MGAGSPVGTRRSGCGNRGPSAGVEPGIKAATELEYRYRLLVLIAIYWIAFSFYPLDRTDLVQLAAGAIAAQGTPHEVLARAFYGLIAIPVLIGAWLRIGAAASARAPQHLGEAGTAAIMLGFGLTLNRPGFLFLALALAIFLYRLSRRRTPRRTVPWREAFLREGYLWIVAAAWVAFALVPKEAVLYSMLVAALLVRGAAEVVLRRNAVFP